MRKWNVVAAAVVAAISATATANAQSAPPAAPRGAAEAATARAGVFNVKMTAIRKSASVPNNAIPTCFVQVFSWNGAAGAWNEEIAGVFAEGTGNNKTCDFSIAYNWPSVESTQQVKVRMWVVLGKEPYPVQLSGGNQVPARKVLQEFEIALPGAGQTVELKRSITY